MNDIFEDLLYINFAVLKYESNIVFVICIGRSIKLSTTTYPKYVTFDLYTTNYGTRSLLTEDMKVFYNCIQIDEIFFAHCIKVDDILENMKVVGCHLEIHKDIKSHRILDNETFNIIVSKEIVRTNKSTQLQFPCKNHDKLISTRTSLENWMKDIEDPSLFWDHFTTAFDPIDLKNPIIDIALPQFFDQKMYKNSQRYMTIETLFGKLLFHGPLNEEKLDSDIIKHPGWRTRLKITISININNQKEPLYVSKIPQ